MIGCSGTGCPKGTASCTESCRNTTTAAHYGLVQDWKLIEQKQENVFKICALRQSKVCLKGEYIIPDDGEISEIEGELADQGIFVLMETRSKLCLSQNNMTTKRPCNVMEDNQRFEIDQHGRLEVRCL